MSLIKKILVPVDFSEISFNALKTARDIAQKTNAEIDILHIFDFSAHIQAMDGSMINPREFDMIYESLKKTCEEGFEAIRKSDEYAGIKFHFHRDSGAISDVILDKVAHLKTELLIMGTSGTHNAIEELIGSLTEKIVRGVNCPVLSIHEYTKKFDPKEIVFASDFKEEIDKPFKIIRKFAENFDTKIHLLRLNTPSSFESTKYANALMEKFAKRNELNNYSIAHYSHEDFNAGLYYYATEETKADVICLATHGRKGILHLFYGGSKAEEIVNHFRLPVLTFKI